jgi:hypothetical protein
MSGVRVRATSREKDGDAGRQGEGLEELADDPGHEAHGAKTAMMVAVVATTARPISSAASIEAA